jgi:hypothetical protein
MSKNQPVMRDMKLNDKVSITLPVHVWLGFVAAYATSNWNCNHASAIASEVADTVLDPVYMNERLAADQYNLDQQQAVLQRLLGQTPDIPPNMEGQ